MNCREGPFADRVYGEHNDLLRDRLGAALARNFDLGVAESFEHAEIARRAQRHKNAQALGSTLPFRASRCMQGDLILGTCLASGGQVKCDHQVLVRHGLVAASTGGGKSVLLTLLLLQSFMLGCGILVTDLHKRELRHLVPLAQRAGTSLVVLRGRDLAINPLQVEDHTDPRTHLSALCSLLRRTLNLPDRAAGVLAWACGELYAKFGVFNGRARVFPHLFEVYEFIRAAPGLNPAAREAVLDRLGGFLSALTPEVGAYRRAWSTSSLLGKQIVLELGAEAEIVKAFHIDWLLRRSFDASIARGNSDSMSRGLKQLFILDDAQHFIAAEGGADGLRPIDEMLGLARGAGVGVLICLQSIAGLRPTLLSNLSTRFTGCLRSHADLTAAACDGGFTPEQVSWCRLHQSVGQFVINMGDGPWRLPMAVQVPFAKVPPVVTDDMVVESQGPLRTLPVQFDERYRNWRAIPFASAVSGEVRSDREARAAHPQAENPARPLPMEQTEEASVPLADAELRVLLAIVDHPGLPSSRYPALAKTSVRRCIQARTFLAEHGYVTEHLVATSTKGRTAVTLHATPLGESVARRARTKAGGPP